MFNFHCLRAQVSGMKILICAAVLELMEHFGVNGLAEARDRFSTLSASDLPDPSSGQGCFVSMKRLRLRTEQIIIIIVLLMHINKDINVNHWYQNHQRQSRISQH